MTDATDFKEIVKQQADIVRVIGDYVKLKKAGAQNYSGFARFTTRKRPRFRFMPRASSIIASDAGFQGMSSALSRRSKM